MAIDIGATVRVKGAYADPGCTIPVTGTVEDAFDFGGVPCFVVMFDEATTKAGIANGMRGVPPGGEFLLERLATV